MRRTTLSSIVIMHFVDRLPYDMLTSPCFIGNSSESNSFYFDFLTKVERVLPNDKLVKTSRPVLGSLVMERFNETSSPPL